MAMDVGESLVGSYLRYAGGCDVVLYNTYTESQGEVDVIGLQLGQPRLVWLCEVSTHLQGTEYGTGYAGTVEKIRAKIERARVFANATFPGETHRYEVWSPISPSGLVSRFTQLEEEFNTADLDVRFVVNSDYTERVQALLHHARTSTKATNEPAYRLLQVLTHLRGELRI